MLLTGALLAAGASAASGAASGGSGGPPLQMSAPAPNSFGSQVASSLKDGAALGS